MPSAYHMRGPKSIDQSIAIKCTVTVIRLVSKMSLVLKKTLDGLYEAMATPPHVKATWSTVEPIPARRLIEELKARGCHQQDIGDAMYEQDQNWIASL